MNPSPYDILSLVGSYTEAVQAIEEMKEHAPADYCEWCRVLDSTGMRYCAPLSYQNGFLRMAS